MGEPEISAMVTRWRRHEQHLEAGLDPELSKRLDDLRREDALLVVRARRALSGLTVATLAVTHVESVSTSHPEQVLRRTG